MHLRFIFCSVPWGVLIQWDEPWLVWFDVLSFIKGGGSKGLGVNGEGRRGVWWGGFPHAYGG